MPHAHALAHARGQLVTLEGAQQRVEVQRRGAMVVAEAGRPVLAMTVSGELDAVAVDVGQVQRLVRPVVGRSLDGGSRCGQAHGRACEVLAARVQQREVEEASGAARRLRQAVLVEHDDCLDAVAELGGAWLVGVSTQPERPVVPGDGTVDIGDGEVHGAESQGRGQRGGATGLGLDVDQGHAISVGPPGP